MLALDGRWFVLVFCHRNRTFFVGEVGLVTWLVGLVGGDTVVEVVVVVLLLLLTEAAGLVFSEKPEDSNEQLLS